ncbi:MAG: hypothetical protein BWX89_01093 [candidate division TA06 bacterium ADurb.Bin131]|uniref:Uncharacterized protein n=1 Tax=candidate division TA06 bacterium ADurb.Bin131 TaxID=1852827 RepID=A0A1V6C894_UNCT6|nr:MAG: hypothetical protein BWX89_01093 [candidate division TA06 bacterium ADurb.Bin131]
MPQDESHITERNALGDVSVCFHIFPVCFFVVSFIKLVKKSIFCSTPEIKNPGFEGILQIDFSMFIFLGTGKSKISSIFPPIGKNC